MIADHAGQLERHIGRAALARVGDDVRGGIDADGQGRAQLLLGIVVAEAHHGGRAIRRLGHLHGQRDGALLVAAQGVARKAAIDRLLVGGQCHLTRGVHDPFDADQHVGHQRIRSLLGSNRAVMSTDPTVTG